MIEQPCGLLFSDIFAKALEECADPDPIHFYALGHALGNAEKVWLGACPAFMIRPKEEHYLDAVKRIETICAAYSLNFRRLTTSRGTELWVCSTSNLHLVERLYQIKENSSEWHLVRGLLCGVPIGQIDYSFHERYKNYDGEGLSG